jgi:hypothetical protein
VVHERTLEVALAVRVTIEVVVRLGVGLGLLLGHCERFITRYLQSEQQDQDWST